MTTAGLEVREAGRALRVQTEAPHLVSMGSGRLSTAVTLHPLPEGRVTVGSIRDAEIPVSGTGVEPIHCVIENNSGVVTLRPINGSTSVDGVPIGSPVRLAQGCMLSIGRSNYMRFNHPAEAKQLRSVLPNSRISMAPISFAATEGSDDAAERHLERKPPVAPRKSPRNSCSDDEGFLGKLTKFEMLARQSRNCVSPKVFPAGGVTTSVPADQILGRSRSSSSLASLRSGGPPRSPANFERSAANSERSAANSERSPATSERNLGRGGHFRAPGPTETDCHREASDEDSEIGDRPSRARLRAVKREEIDPEASSPSRASNPDLRGRSAQSFGSSPASLRGGGSPCSPAHSERSLGRSGYARAPGPAEADYCREASDEDSEIGDRPSRASNPDLRGRSAQGSGSSPPARRLQPPSPMFNRNPEYCERRRWWCAAGPGGGRSLEELRERQVDAEKKRQEAERRRERAQEDRLREQEVERREKSRLEEILAMCAEYERRSLADKPRQPNRIKTNGSLPRDKRPGYNSPFDSPKSPSKSQPHFSFESSRQTSPAAAYENVAFQNCRPMRNGDASNDERAKSVNVDDDSASHRECLQTTTPDNSNRSPGWPSTCQGKDTGNGGIREGERGFSGSLSRSRTPNYENVVPRRSNDSPRSSTIERTAFGKIQLNGTRIAVHDSGRNYENFVPLNGNADSAYENVTVTNGKATNNKDGRASLKRNGQLSNSCEVIENKLAISNDDLLEAIEQLSMLSKSKDICTTPKRNNSERDNAKSNEAKADKERKELEEEDRRKYIGFLRNEKIHILGNMDALKRSVADIEIQEEDINREFELEKALLSAEYESESLKLTQDESEKIRVQVRINELEKEMTENNATQANLQSEAKQRVQKAQQACNCLEEELSNCMDEMVQQELVEKLRIQQDVLESERKAFEDLEFHHLEEEASKLATREELQRYLSELSARIEARKSQLNHLDSQRNEAKTTATKDTRSLERQKLGHMRRLEEGRNRIRAIDDELENLAQNSHDNSDEKRSPSREDFDRISRVTTDSPIVNTQGSLGRKTIESLKEIERNRQLHLAKQGSQVISEERRRVEELKRRVQDEVRSQWEERKMNCASFNSVESGEESSSYSTGPTESGSGSSDGVDGGASEKLSPSKLSEFTSSSPGPSNNSYSLLQNDSARDDARTSMEGERLSSTSGGVADGNGSRPLSQTSSEMDTIGPLQTIKRREKTKLQRPLTRYLPIKSESLDLRNHIETAGHQLQLIHDVSVDAISCCGYLSKMSKKFHHWNKRWFVFDRKRKTLAYYSDNTTRKARGVIYFQSIEEVYVDHMNTVRSPQPSLTFIIKTSSRLYHLMAPSPETMRVWVDVVFTGAEGYHEFEHGV
ncbi:pleckstrin homology-like domain family B member 1 [Orussus abietinus]|uniref:pleckstrin homology-like domain family B member 1 n=1 Tax=Orussus abietinus TaxID=222816 RepID=UPI0006264FF5|nr:pleckstrin homology-like domain family B member 1 [Orussus abietinus]